MHILSHELYKNVLDGGAFWTRGVGFGWVRISNRGGGLWMGVHFGQWGGFWMGVHFRQGSG